MKDPHSITPYSGDVNTLIGQLDRDLSEFLLLTEAPALDEADAQTLKHHADDLIGVGQKALETLKIRMSKATVSELGCPAYCPKCQGEECVHCGSGGRMKDCVHDVSNRHGMTRVEPISGEIKSIVEEVIEYAVCGYCGWTHGQHSNACKHYEEPAAIFEPTYSGKPPIWEFGIYCPQHNIWVRGDSGRAASYPSAAMADIDRKMMEPTHLWITEKFGEQVPVDPTTLPVGSDICTFGAKSITKPALKPHCPACNWRHFPNEKHFPSIGGGI